MQKDDDHAHVHGHDRHHHHAPGVHRHDGLLHVHAPADFGRAFALGIGLNLTFVAVEATCGVLSNSVALIADAGHNLSDVLGLVVAWAASALTQRPPTARYTYGLGGSSILAALFNAVFLLVAVGAIGWEAVQRFAAPQPVVGMTMVAVAAVGIVINGITAWLFASGRKGDINIRGAFLHMVADAAVSAGVGAAGVAILFTGWLWLDPLVSLIIVAVIVWSTWDLLRQALAMSLGAVPDAIDPAAVRGWLAARSGVDAVHDLHIWPTSTTATALTAHLVMPAGHPGDAFLMSTAAQLHQRFGIGHVTLQIETDAEAACPLAPDHVV
jgi:cobalt-zinc-cadmium efflux system protein